LQQKSIVSLLLFGNLGTSGHVCGECLLKSNQKSIDFIH